MNYINPHALEATLGFGLMGMFMLNISVMLPPDLKYVSGIPAAIMFALAIYMATGIEIKT